MQKHEYERLIEQSWRRPLTAEERALLQAHLAEHPADSAPWAGEAALNKLLERLPAAAVSSNFTARVLAEVGRAPLPRPRLPLWRVLCTSFATAAAALGMLLLATHEQQAALRMQEARQLALAAHQAPVPPIEWMANFDTIQHLDKVKVADDDLLAALK